MSLRRRLACGVSAAAWLGCAATAQAQVPAQPAPQSAQDDAESATVDEIVVTATRREERLQDVPLAVTAANAEALAAARVENIVNIKALTPSISFSQTNNATSSANIQIRSIGTVGNSRAFEGAVGVFIDGVYRTRSGQALQNFLDIETVQVLRGPQGTLFGKNTSAGAILVSSNAPELGGGVSGNYELTVGNYNSLLARGAVNLPVSDTLAFRLAAVSDDREGFIENPNTGEDYNDRHARAFKAQALWAPTADLEVRLIADYAREQENCCYGTVDANDGPTQPLINALIAATGQRPPSTDIEDYEAVLNYNTDQEIIDQGASLQVAWSTPLGGELTSITALRRWELAQDDIDADFTGADILGLEEAFTSDFFSQEFTYTGEIGATSLFRSADYVAGLYYSDEVIQVDRGLFWGPQAQTYWDTLLGARGLPPGTVAAVPGRWTDENMHSGGKSYAAFAQTTVDFTDNFSVIAGLRYTKELRRGSFFYEFFDPRRNAVFRVLGVSPGPAYAAKVENEAVSGTFGLQYRFSPQAQGYLTYSRGFKAGGVNIDPSAAGVRANNPAETPGGVPNSPTFRSEFVDGYELGFKADYLDGRARTNVALFYNQLEDLQVAQFLGLQFRILNAPAATVYGAEIENTLQVTDDLAFDLAATWLPEAQFDTSAALGAPLSGRRFPTAPRISANAAARFERELNANFGVEARLAVRHQSEIFTTAANNATEEAVTLLNASVGLKQLNQGWTLSAFCQNCADERYVATHFNTPLQTGDEGGYVGAPRTYGLSLRGRF